MLFVMFIYHWIIFLQWFFFPGPVCKFIDLWIIPICNKDTDTEKYSN